MIYLLFLLVIACQPRQTAPSEHRESATDVMTNQPVQQPVEEDTQTIVSIQPDETVNREVMSEKTEQEAVMDDQPKPTTNTSPSPTPSATLTEELRPELPSNIPNKEITEEEPAHHIEVEEVESQQSTPVQGQVVEDAPASNHDMEQVTPDDSAPVFPAIESTKPTVVASVVDHATWDLLLKKYVSSAGVVNYKAWSQDRNGLDEYIKGLEADVPTQSDRSDDAKAYWINAYNAYTIKLILDHYPVTSIRDLDGGNPWDVKRIKLGGTTYSLNDIEHNILRPYWLDARIHFAVNCAAQSCPPISNTAFTGANLDSELDRLTRVFIEDDRYNQLTARLLSLSKIFEWYAADFGDIVTFINKYSHISARRDVKIQYIDYDWALNGQ